MFISHAFEAIASTSNVIQTLIDRLIDRLTFCFFLHLKLALVLLEEVAQVNWVSDTLLKILREKAATNINVKVISTNHRLSKIHFSIHL